MSKYWESLGHLYNFLEDNPNCRYKTIVKQLHKCFNSDFPSLADIKAIPNQQFWSALLDTHNDPLKVVRAIYQVYLHKYPNFNLHNPEYIVNLFDPNVVFQATDDFDLTVFFYHSIGKHLRPLDFSGHLTNTITDLDMDLPNKWFLAPDEGDASAISYRYASTYLLVINRTHAKILMDAYQEFYSPDPAPEIDPYYKNLYNITTAPVMAKIRHLLKSRACTTCHTEYFFDEEEIYSPCELCKEREDIMDILVSTIEEGLNVKEFSKVLIKRLKSLNSKRIEQTLSELTESLARDARAWKSKRVNHNNIEQYLNRYVYGQNKLTSILAKSSAAYLNHLVSYEIDRTNGDQDVVPHSFTLLVGGDTGTGKTYTIKKLGEHLNMPVINVDVTSLSPEGYVGGSLSDILKEAERTINTFYSLQNTSREIFPYIIVFDEVDKLLTASDSTRSFYQGVQSGLLKCIESGVVTSEKTKHLTCPYVILSGSFMSPRKKNEGPQFKVGFKPPADDEVKPINHQQLLQYGLLPELVGRISIVTETNSFTEQDYVNLLTKTDNNALDKTLDFGRQLGIEHTQEDKDLLIKEAAKFAITSKTGVRGLESFLISKLFGQLE